jgi:glycosyltransferase involved in cell wall biosynthesis
MASIDNNIVLTIAIPTFNRANFLDAILKELMRQIDVYNISGQIEILVSNNNSTDSTEEIIAKHHNRIQYSCHSSNIGADRNFLSLFEKARGKYIWLPGDDDLVRNDLLPFILKSIESEQFDFFYLKKDGKERNGEKRRPRMVSSDELFEKVNLYLTFMTSQVIRTSLVKKHIKGSAQFEGTYMMYFYIFLKCLEEAKKCLISGGREIYLTPGNTGGYKFYNVWASGVLDVFNSSKFSQNVYHNRIFVLRLLIVLLLPVTYVNRFKNSNFSFNSEDPRNELNKYFAAGFYRRLLDLYLSAPYIILFPLHAVLRIMHRVWARLSGFVS